MQAKIDSIQVSVALVCLGLGANIASAQDNALQFGGTGQVFNVPYDDAFPRGDFTVSVRFRIDPANFPPTVANPSLMVSRANDQTSDSGDMFNTPLTLGFIVDGSLTFRIENDTGSAVGPAIDLNDLSNPALELSAPINAGDGQWHSLAVTLRGTRTAIAIDGEIAYDQPFNNPTFAPAFAVGTQLTLGGLVKKDSGVDVVENTFVGEIDDVSYWGRGMAREELAELTRSLPACNCAGLLGYWRFDESALDQLGQDFYRGRTGTLGLDDQVASDDPIRVPAAGKPVLDNERSLGGGDDSVDHPGNPPVLAAAVRGDEIVWTVTASGAQAAGSVAIFYPAFGAPNCFASAAPEETLWTGPAVGGLPPMVASFDGTDTATYTIGLPPGQLLGTSTCVSMTMQALVQPTATTPIENSNGGSGPQDDIAFSDGVILTVTR